MMLPSLPLDDLNWRGMVDAIRSRIAAVSDEEWTLHAPVDPGVTLLELFAYKLEQRVYWLDQVGAPLINALIAMLGVELRRAQAARTVLEITAGTPELSAGIVFERRDQELPVRIATGEELAVLPVERVELTTPFGTASAVASTQPRWAIQPITLLPASDGAAEAWLTLWLRNSPSREQWGKSFALLLDLEGPQSIPASWAVDAVDNVPVPAQLQWSYGVEATPTPVAFAAEAVSDGTQGLRRSGLVRFVIPEQWAPSQAAVGNLFPFRLRLSAARCTFSAPPRLRRAVPNAVTATHAVPVMLAWPEIEKQVREWLPLPGLQLQLSDRAPPLESTVTLRLLGRDNNWREWTPTSDFARHGPEDAVLLVDRVANCLRFGDGLTGRLPVLSSRAGMKAALRYYAGGGLAGNVGSNLSWVAAAPASAEAINPVPARGGRESETPAEARDRVGASLNELYRAVTALDYESLATGTRGVAVARAHAAPGLHPGFPCVSVPGAITLFIVPEVPRKDGWQSTDSAVFAPRPDPGMLSLIAQQLDERRLITAEVFVRSPSYREVDVAVTLFGIPVDQESVARRLRDGLRAYLDALVGGAEHQGWPFGQPVRPSEILHVLEQLAGEEAQITQVGVRLFDPAQANAAFQSCDDLPIEPHSLVVLRSLDLTWQSSAESSGGLR